MFRKRITRRSFLKKAGKTTAAAYIVAGAGMGGMLFPSKEAWAASLKSLSRDQGEALLAMIRQLFPHDRLGDQYYWAAVAGIDGEMAGLAELERQIEDGLVKLDQVFGVKFRNLSEGNQLTAVKSVEGTPFFSTVLGKANTLFYNNKKLWSQFGYEGSSWEFGGYLNRGFDDIGWLPKA